MGTVTEQKDSEEIWRNKKASHKLDTLNQAKLARQSYQCQCLPRTASTTCGRISASPTDVCVVEGKFLPTIAHHPTKFHDFVEQYLRPLFNVSPSNLVIFFFFNF